MLIKYIFNSFTFNIIILIIIIIYYAINTFNYNFKHLIKFKNYIIKSIISYNFYISYEDFNKMNIIKVLYNKRRLKNSYERRLFLRRIYKKRKR